MPARVIVAAVALVGVLTSAARTSSIGNPASDANVERHHYAINARVRALVLFWMDCPDVGDAIFTARKNADGADYSLLIGSDPQRAPQRINRWGYLAENTRGTNATVIGLMTESDETSLAQAAADVEKNGATRTFKLIRTSVAGDEARSTTSAMPVPSEYSFRQIGNVLDLARRAPVKATTQTVRMPAGTRAGFLTALDDLVQTHVKQWQAARRVDGGEPVRYVHRGRIYELKAVGTRPMSSVPIGGTTYQHVITSQFEIKARGSGAVTRFSMTYGADGRYAAVPLSASVQPRWWLQVELILDDTTSSRSAVAEVTR